MPSSLRPCLLLFVLLPIAFSTRSHSTTSSPAGSNTLGTVVDQANSTFDNATTIDDASNATTQPSSNSSSPQSNLTSSAYRRKEPMKAPTEANETAIMKKMHIHVQKVKGVAESSHRAKVMSSVYVAKGRAVVLRAVSTAPVDLFQPSTNFSKLPRDADGGPQRYTLNGWCHRQNQDTVYEEFDCYCFYGYSGIFCEEEHSQRGWIAGIWWSLILLEIVLLLFALFRLWKKWTLKPTLEPVRFVEVIMSEDPNYVSTEVINNKKATEPATSRTSAK